MIEVETNRFWDTGNKRTVLSETAAQGLSFGYATQGMLDFIKHENNLLHDLCLHNLSLTSSFITLLATYVSFFLLYFRNVIIVNSKHYQAARPKFL